MTTELLDLEDGIHDSECNTHKFAEIKHRSEEACNLCAGTHTKDVVRQSELQLSDPDNCCRYLHNVCIVIF